jgi:peptidase E
MPQALRQIVAFGGGGFSMESGNPLLDDYVLGLGRNPRRPRVCFLPSASGDADHYVVRFYRAFPADRCEASHISLFRREQGPEDLREHLLSQDLIYVGGGKLGRPASSSAASRPARSAGSTRR